MNPIVFLACIAVAAASGSNYHGSHVYHGRYAGSCGNDGFYYNTQNSFVICSNGNAYHQPCAPGSRNSGYGKYTYGNKYGYSDFCDVNLVDYGYGASHGSYGGHRSYGHDSYGPGYYGHGHGYGYGGYGHGSYGHGYGYGSYDRVRPERYNNANGYATRDAYNHRGYGDHGYGYAAPHPHGGYGAPSKTVVHKSVSVSKH